MQPFHITAVTTAMLKGRTGSVALAHLSIVAGPNGSGKTALRHGIEYVLTGAVGELGKRSKAILTALSNTQAMTATLDFSNGSRFTRALMVSGSSTKTECDISGEISPEELTDIASLSYPDFGALNPDEQAEIMAKHGFVETIELKKFKEWIESVHRPKVPTEVWEGTVRNVVAHLPEKATAIDLAKMIEQLEENAKGFRVRIRDMTGGTRSVEELRSTLKESSTSIETTINTLRERQTKIQGDLRLAKAARTSLSTVALDMAKRTEESAKHTMEATEAGYDKTRIEKLEASLVELSVKTGDLVSRTARASELVRATKQSIAEIIAKLASLKDASACPLCGGATDHWKENAQETWKGILEANRNTISLQEDAQKTLIEDRLALEEAAHTLNDRLRRERRRLNDIEQARAHYQTAVTNRKALEAAAADRPEPVVAPAEIEDLEAASNEVAMELKGACQRHQEATLVENAIHMSIQMGKARAAADYSLTAIVTMRDLLTDLRTRLAEEGIGRLLELANRIAGSAMRSPIVSVDGGFGRDQKGEFIPFVALSGSEQALTNAALSAALASKNTFKLLMLDEAGNLTDDTFQRLCKCLEKALDDHLLDQVILFKPVDSPASIPPVAERWLRVTLRC